MKLYIEIENGLTKNHPAFEDNLVQAFGEVPAHWAAFIRIERPELTVYQTLDLDEPSYEKVNGVWTDVWALRDMSSDEQSAKQELVVTAFRNRRQASNWAAWTLDEATCTMVPPIPHQAPDLNKLKQNIFTYWCGADNNWKDTPAMPQDGNNHNFDFIAWQWI